MVGVYLPTTVKSIPMITSQQHEESIEVCGLKIIVVTRTKLMVCQQGGTLVFTGDKRPIGIICRSDDNKEEIFLKDL